MPARRRKFELLLQDFDHALNRPPDPANPRRLSEAVDALRYFNQALIEDPEKLHATLMFGTLLRSFRGPDRQVAEESLLRFFLGLAHQVETSLEELRTPKLTGFDDDAELSPEQRRLLQVLRALHDFALNSYHFTRPRDSFSGARRAYALSTFSRIVSVVHLPHVIPLAERSKTDGRSFEAGWAAEFLHRNHCDFGWDDDELPDPDAPGA